MIKYQYVSKACGSVDEIDDFLNEEAGELEENQTMEIVGYQIRQREPNNLMESGREEIYITIEFVTEK